jgi:transposase-like protein
MDQKTHLVRGCPHCGSTYYNRKREITGRSRVSIFYLCEKCNKKFITFKMVEVKDHVKTGWQILKSLERVI